MPCVLSAQLSGAAIVKPAVVPRAAAVSDCHRYPAGGGAPAGPEPLPEPLFPEPVPGLLRLPEAPRLAVVLPSALLAPGAPPGCFWPAPLRPRDPLPDGWCGPVPLLPAVAADPAGARPAAEAGTGERE